MQGRDFRSLHWALGLMKIQRHVLGGRPKPRHQLAHDLSVGPGWLVTHSKVANASVCHVVAIVSRRLQLQAPALIKETHLTESLNTGANFSANP